MLSRVHPTMNRGGELGDDARLKLQDLNRQALRSLLRDYVYERCARPAGQPHSVMTEVAALVSMVLGHKKHTNGGECVPGCVA